MATDIERLVLQLSADIRGMEKALDRAAKKTNDSAQQVERRFDTMNSRVSKAGSAMANNLRGAIAAIGIGLAVRETVEYADAWTTARNRLAAAGVATEDLARQQARLVDLSIETRTDFEATVDLYARLQRASANLSASQQDIERATRITNQAFKAGGAAASEQRSAILQLGQALGSGVLQGDELRSLRENAPLLAKAIADEFDTTVAGLKKLGEQGELTSERVFNAILNGGAGIEAQFARTDATVSDVLTNLGTRLTAFVGALDRAIGGSSAFRNIMDGVTGAVEDATAAINAASDAADAGFEGLPRRMLEAMAASEAYVGSTREARAAIDEQADAVENLSDAELELRREQRRSGEFQKQEHLQRLRDVRTEILEHQRRLEISLAELQVAQASALYQGSAYRNRARQIEVLRVELEAAARALGRFDEQIDRVVSSDPSVFMDEAAASTATLTSAVDKGSNSWREYQTDLEKLEETLGEIAGAQALLVQQLQAAEDAVVNAINADDGGAEAFARIEQATAALEAIRQEFTAQTGASRGAIAALIDYARATEDVAGAVKRLQSLGPLISPSDNSLALEELRKLSKELDAQILEGEDAVVADFNTRMDQIQRARAAAIALGITDLGRYERAAAAAQAAFAEALNALYEIQNPFQDIDLGSFEADLPEFEIIGEEFRRIMRDSVKTAMKEGIQTDDWGTAFRGILADAVVAGMDDALNQLGDFLADFFFGANGQQGFFNFVAQTFSFGGGRAGGGPMHRNSYYNVNEQGTGEVLFLGKTAGEMLNANQFRDALSGLGGGGGSIHIDNRMIIQGDMADRTLARAEEARKRSELLLMQRLPGVIDGRVNESIVHRRIRRS